MEGFNAITERNIVEMSAYLNGLIKTKSYESSSNGEHVTYCKLNWEHCGDCIFRDMCGLRPSRIKNRIYFDKAGRVNVCGKKKFASCPNCSEKENCDVYYKLKRIYIDDAKNIEEAVEKHLKNMAENKVPKLSDEQVKEMNDKLNKATIPLGWFDAETTKPKPYEHVLIKIICENGKLYPNTSIAYYCGAYNDWFGTLGFEGGRYFSRIKYARVLAWRPIPEYSNWITADVDNLKEIKEAQRKMVMDAFKWMPPDGTLRDTLCCASIDIKPKKKEEDMNKQNDPVNHPSHYTQGGVECIEAIKASMSPEEFSGYLKGNSIKYLWRYRNKGKAKEDLKKAQWYLNRLIEES